jgi:iron complex transport system substrate-binding protein
MKYPERIVCLTEEPTEMLYLLGEQARIVGISAYTERPSQAKQEKPVVSAFIKGNLQKIQNLQPDLVIGFSDIQSELAKDLIALGLNVWITNQRSLEEIYSTMFWISAMVGKSDLGKVYIEDWKKKIETVRTKAHSLPKKKVFFQEWNEPIITGIRWVSEMIEICGGMDVYSEKKMFSLAKDRIISRSDLGKSKPEVWVNSWCGKETDREWILSGQEWADSPAVLQNQIFDIDPSIILQPGPALFLSGIDAMFECIQGVRP